MSELATRPEPEGRGRIGVIRSAWLTRAHALMGAFRSLAAHARLRATVGALLLSAGAVLAACGPSAVVQIPTPRPNPKPGHHPVRLSSPPREAVPTARPVVVAPGVVAPAAALAAPLVTVSRRHPPPRGTPVSLVVADFLRDNYIENVALERGDPTLLRYADAGDFLRAETRQVVGDTAKRVAVQSIRDNFSAIAIGSQKDPNDSSVGVALIVTGVEQRSTVLPSGRHVKERTRFDALVWCMWSKLYHEFQVVDLGEPVI